MPRMSLMGGEKDGWETTVSEDGRPDVFYVVPNLDEELIKKAKGHNAKLELRDKLAVVAYKFNKDESTATHFKMYRAPELDRVRQS